MYQLNIKLKPGELTREGHPHQGWNTFHSEFFEGENALEALSHAIEYWRARGVTVALGEKTGEIIGRYARVQSMLGV